MTVFTPAAEYFAIAAPGLAPLVAAELRELASFGVRDVAEHEEGVAFGGGADALLAANLWLRTASRVLVRLASFRARTFFELERKSNTVAWTDVVGTSRPVSLRVTCRKSKLYHSGAVAQRVQAAIERRIGAVELRDTEDADDDAPPQLVVVRVARDVCTISADASGALLHRRGYRQAVARAPLRETLAAALLAGSGWRGNAPLLDPMCGSGTIPIEGALMARRIAPALAGGGRSFAFMDWPGYDGRRWSRLVARARESELPAAAVGIRGSDRDSGAIEAALANAQRAGVSSDIRFSVASLSAMEPPGGEGWLVSNPPYGVRVGESDDLRDLYARVGQIARQRLHGWHVALLSADPRLEAQTRLPFESRLATSNGGIRVRLVVAHVPSRVGSASRSGDAREAGRAEARVWDGDRPPPGATLE